VILRGRAVGGPRDQVILEAGPRWTGFLVGHTKARYVWDVERNTWVWTEVEKPKTGANA